jgi:hypothetical protein
VELAKYVSACCPQQRFNEFTPDAWHDLLGQYDQAECRTAVIAVASRQPFVAPAEIIAEITAARRARAGRVRRARLDADLPQFALTAGADTRLTRREIDAILASAQARTGRHVAISAPPERQSAASIEAERRRQIAALENLMDQDT